MEMGVLLIVIVIGGLALLLLAWRIKQSGQATALPYQKKQYLLSRAEHDFFSILQRLFADQYYIFPQVSLNSVLYVDRRGGEFVHYFNKIRQKSLDFVLADKVYLTPLLVIELDDRSHTAPGRVARDQFVDSALNMAGVRFLRVPNRRVYDVPELERQIRTALAR